MIRDAWSYVALHYIHDPTGGNQSQIEAWVNEDPRKSSPTAGPWKGPWWPAGPGWTTVWGHKNNPGSSGAADSQLVFTNQEFYQGPIKVSTVTPQGDFLGLLRPADDSPSAPRGVTVK